MRRVNIIFLAMVLVSMFNFVNVVNAHADSMQNLENRIDSRNVQAARKIILLSLREMATVVTEEFMLLSSMSKGEIEVSKEECEEMYRANLKILETLAFYSEMDRRHDLQLKAYIMPLVNQVGKASIYLGDYLD